LVFTRASNHVTMCHMPHTRRTWSRSFACIMAVVLLSAPLTAAAADEPTPVELEALAVVVAGDLMTVAFDQPDRCSWQTNAEVILEKKLPPDAVVRISATRVNPQEICAQVLTRATLAAPFPIGAASIRSTSGTVLWLRPTRSTVQFAATAISGGRIAVTTTAARAPSVTRIQINATAKGRTTLTGTLNVTRWIGNKRLSLAKAIPGVTYTVRTAVTFSDGTIVTSRPLTVKAR
jgi:hypothetical protein